MNDVKYCLQVTFVGDESPEIVGPFTETEATRLWLLPAPDDVESVERICLAPDLETLRSWRQDLDLSDDDA